MSINLNIAMINRLRKPNMWNTYRDPYVNLLHGILLQALVDCKGYQECGTNKHHNGDEAIEFVHEYGADIVEIITNAEKAPLNDSTNETRRYRKAKIFPNYECMYCSCEGECVARNAPCSYNTCYNDLNKDMI